MLCKRVCTCAPAPVMYAMSARFLTRPTAWPSGVSAGHIMPHRLRRGMQGHHSERCHRDHHHHHRHHRKPGDPHYCQQQQPQLLDSDACEEHKCRGQGSQLKLQHS